MNLSFITKAVATANTAVNVQQEADLLLVEARDQIGLFEAADEWLSNKLATLPTVVEGGVWIKFEDSRKFVQYKEQSLSECLWVNAVKQIQYHSSANKQLLQAAFANWINEHCYRQEDDLGRPVYARVHVELEEMEDLAIMYVVALQTEGVLKSNLEKRVITLDAGNQVTAKVYNMSDEFHDELNDLIATLRDRVSMKCRPLAHMPMDWTDAKNGIAEGTKIPLVARAKTKSVKVSQLVLDAVNKLQRVKFVVAPAIVAAAKDMALNAPYYTSSVMKGKFADKELTKEAFALYSETEVYKGKEFFFPVTLDSRGRMYYRGGLLSPQGVDFCKAAFQFANYKPLGKYGFKAICLHTANVCGQDKISINDRVRWVRDNWETIMDTRTHIDVRNNFKGADTFQALVACTELRRLAELDGEWEDRESNLVCHQDGTCNGLQHMAAITGDRATAEAVNCTPSSHDDVPTDIYGLVAKAATHKSQGVAQDLIVKYGRSMAKNPVMVTGYGAQESTIIKNTASYLSGKREDTTVAGDVGTAYLEAIDEVAGAVTQLTQALTTRVGYAIEEGKRKFTWKTADGFIASTQYELDETLAVRVGNFYIRKRGMGAAPLDARKTAQAMSPNFVHSIDSTHLRMVVTGCDHELVTVHDSIGSHPADYFVTARVVREKFALVHKGFDALKDLCDSMGQPVPEFPRVGDYDAGEALESSYIFS